MLNRRCSRFPAIESTERQARFLQTVVVFACVISSLSVSTTAQSAADVHITPRQVTGEMAGDAGAARVHLRSIVKEVNLVLVPVTVTNYMGHPVTGLEKENFVVYEGQAKQTVQYFFSEDAPVSVGILFDASGSMFNKIEQARRAIAEFLKTANPQDEFSVITFSDRPQLICDFGSSPEDIQSQLKLVRPKGATALLDAVYLGLTKAVQGQYPRRALLIVSDGGDNNSRYSEREVMELAREADTPIYAIGIHTAPQTKEERSGRWMLNEMTEASGGIHFSIEQTQDLSDVTTKIGYLLHNQYVLGYKPSNTVHDGKWRKIKVKLDPPNLRRDVRVYAKAGYYGSAR